MPNKNSYSYHKTTSDGVDYSSKYEDGVNPRATDGVSVSNDDQPRKPSNPKASVKESPISISGGAGKDQKTIRSKSVYTNALRKSYTDKYGQQPIETGHSNSYDEEDKKKVYYQKNKKIETTMGLPHKGKKPKK